MHKGFLANKLQTEVQFYTSAISNFIDAIRLDSNMITVGALAVCNLRMQLNV